PLDRCDGGGLCAWASVRTRAHHAPATPCGPRGPDERGLHRATRVEPLWRSRTVDHAGRLARHVAVVHRLRKVSAVAALSGDDAGPWPPAACGVRGCARSVRAFVQLASAECRLPESLHFTECDVILGVVRARSVHKIG